MSRESRGPDPFFEPSDYIGAVVSNGLVVFGLGYWLGNREDDWWDDHSYIFRCKTPTRRLRR